MGLDERNRASAGVAELADARASRNEQIVELFHRECISIDLEEIGFLAGTQRIGRPHIAEALVRKGLVQGRQEAFDKYLGKGRPFYLPKDCLALEVALRLIRVAGGLAVVAHPYSLFIGKPKLAALMDEWKTMGVAGIEAYHPAAKLGQCRILERMARQRGFLVTAGSDFHDLKKPECGIGRSAGGLAIDDSYYEELVCFLSGSAV